MRNNLFAALGAAAVLTLLVAPAFASTTAANKATVAAGNVDLLSAKLSATSGTVSASETLSLLSTTIKTSSTMDLLFTVSLECALWTSLATTGNFDSSNRASVVVWVEMDGAPVTVGSGDPNAGKVVFCDRMHRQVTSNFDDEDAKIEQFLNTRTANSFQWVIVDAGSATHSIEVKARLETSVSGTGTAQAGIGQRTLVVEPIHLASGFEF